MAQIPFSGVRTPVRQGSIDVRNDLVVQQNHYIGIDVGTGSARACIINETGDIVGLSSENIGLWQPQTGYYVCRFRLQMTHPSKPLADLRLLLG